MAAIQLKKVSHHYTQSGGDLLAALSAINLSIESGDIVALIGESGAGKSTLLRSINLLERPARGEVWVAGKNLLSLNRSQLRDQRQKIGMIFQHFNLLKTATVFDNIALPLKLHGFEPSEIDKRVDKLLALTGLKDKRDAYPQQLSGGQQQRVAIARALVTEPKVLLCDEATSALDVENAQSVLTLLKRLNQTLGITIVMVTHQLEVAKQIADRVVMLAQGSVVEDSSVVGFFSNPQSELGQKMVALHYDRPLPEKLQRQIRPEPGPGDVAVMRLTFCGALTFEPMVSDFTKTHQVPLNILQGNVEYVHGELLGHLWVTADAAGLTVFEPYFEERGVKVDVLGYLAISA